MPTKTKPAAKLAVKLNKTLKIEKKLSRYCRSGRVLW